MQLVNVTSLEMGASAAARKAGNTKATKRLDLYRKYSASLRKAMNLDVMNSFLAKDTLRELFLEQPYPQTIWKTRIISIRTPARRK